jgi:hypothetical protein
MKVPAGHNEQVAADADVAPACPYFPSTEHGVPEHVDKEVAPTPSECVPAGQSQQTSAPVSSTYVPAGHSCGAVAPAVDTNEPAGADKQAPAAVDPVSGLYVPAAHAVHVVPASESWYVPAADNDAVRGRTKPTTQAR